MKKTMKNTVKNIIKKKLSIIIMVYILFISLVISYAYAYECNNDILNKYVTQGGECAPPGNIIPVSTGECTGQATDASQCKISIDKSSNEELVCMMSLKESVCIFEEADKRLETSEGFRNSINIQDTTSETARKNWYSNHNLVGSAPIKKYDEGYLTTGGESSTKFLIADFIGSEILQDGCLKMNSVKLCNSSISKGDEEYNISNIEERITEIYADNPDTLSDLKTLYINNPAGVELHMGNEEIYSTSPITITSEQETLSISGEEIFIWKGMIYRQITKSSIIYKQDYSFISLQENSEYFLGYYVFTGPLSFNTDPFMYYKTFDTPYMIYWNATLQRSDQNTGYIYELMPENYSLDNEYYSYHTQKITVNVYPAPHSNIEIGQYNMIQEMVVNSGKDFNVTYYEKESGTSEDIGMVWIMEGNVLSKGPISAIIKAMYGTPPRLAILYGREIYYCDFGSTDFNSACKQLRQKQPTKKVETNMEVEYIDNGIYTAPTTLIEAIYRSNNLTPSSTISSQGIYLTQRIVTNTETNIYDVLANVMYKSEYIPLYDQKKQALMTPGNIILPSGYDDTALIKQAMHREMLRQNGSTAEKLKSAQREFFTWMKNTADTQDEPVADATSGNNMLGDLLGNDIIQGNGGVSGVGAMIGNDIAQGMGAVQGYAAQSRNSAMFADNNMEATIYTLANYDWAEFYATLTLCNDNIQVPITAKACKEFMSRHSEAYNEYKRIYAEELYINIQD
ncbi:MAG: hypothetical protein ACP5NW_02120 [Candidatus Woesearchaeota archaeon]